MQTTGNRRTHWIAGMVAAVVTVGSFGSQLLLAEHYAQAGVSAGGIALASRTPSVVSQHAADPAQLKTATQEPVAQTAPKKLSAS